MPSARLATKTDELIEVLRHEVRDAIYDALGNVQLQIPSMTFSVWVIDLEHPLGHWVDVTYGGQTFALPEDLRSNIADGIMAAIDPSSGLSAYTRIDAFVDHIAGINVVGSINDLARGVLRDAGVPGEFIEQLMPEDPLDPIKTAVSGMQILNRAFPDLSGLPFVAFERQIWYLLMYELLTERLLVTSENYSDVSFCLSVDWINEDVHPESVVLEGAKQLLYSVAHEHRNGILAWIAGHMDTSYGAWGTPASWTRSWPEAFNGTKYLWSTDRSSQDEDFSNINHRGRSSRTDFIQLRGLYDWSQGASIFGRMGGPAITPTLAATSSTNVAPTNGVLLAAPRFSVIPEVAPFV